MPATPPTPAITITITREPPDSPDARALITELDDHLGARYPAESRHGYSVDKLLREGVAFFIIRVRDDPSGTAIPAGCGGVLLVGNDYAEIKRMYTRPAFRGRGLARLMLDHLAAHVRATNPAIPLLRLETGILQTDAIALYEKSGFTQTPPFGPYRDDPNSRFYAKVVTAEVV